VLVALVGSGSASGLLPVVESFAVLQVTGSAGKLGIVLACQGAVALLVSLAGGVAGDRFSRGRILIASSVVRMAAAVTLAVTLLAHRASFGVLLGMAVVYGCADGFFAPVSTALLPDVVPAAQLAAANALIGGVSSSATIVAPAVAGVIVAALGPGSGFACEAAVLAVTAGCLAAARLPAGCAGPAAGRNVLDRLRAGWRVFARLRWLWLLTLQWTVFSFLILAPVAVLGPTIAREFLGGAAAWGLINSCLILGTVGGQLAAGRIRPARPALLAACLSPVGIVEALALGLGAPVAVVGVAAAATGVAMGLQFVIFQTTMQTTVPAAALARVSAFDLLGSELAQPVGYVLAGPIGAAVGLHSFLTTSAAVAFIVVAALALPPSLRETTRTLSHRAEVSIEPGEATGR
jgi:MFS family permease